MFYLLQVIETLKNLFKLKCSADSYDLGVFIQPHFQKYKKKSKFLLDVLNLTGMKKKTTQIRNRACLTFSCYFPIHFLVFERAPGKKCEFPKEIPGEFLEESLNLCEKLSLEIARFEETFEGILTETHREISKRKNLGNFGDLEKIRKKNSWRKL